MRSCARARWSSSGASALRFEFSAESNRLPVSAGNAFGKLVGASVAMRTAFALLERAAQSDVTVLLEGETGTGKGVAAEAIHRASTRAAGPFLVVDCGAIPPNLLESELFGHEKGAFTGAVARRVGAFEEASGGTIFLDEIGELAADLQPKLLRVLESKEYRRVGGNAMQKTDVRVVAATNRDLRAEVNAGRFRSDLYFRLAVVKVTIPALRERPEDIPITVETILRALGADEASAAALRTPEFFAALGHSAWPGNVRELRNYLERCLVFQEALPVSTERAGGGGVRRWRGSTRSCRTPRRGGARSTASRGATPRRSCASTTARSRRRRRRRAWIACTSTASSAATASSRA